MATPNNWTPEEKQAYLDDCVNQDTQFAEQCDRLNDLIGNTIFGLAPISRKVQRTIYEAYKPLFDTSLRMLKERAGNRIVAYNLAFRPVGYTMSDVQQVIDLTDAAINKKTIAEVGVHEGAEGIVNLLMVTLRAASRFGVDLTKPFDDGEVTEAAA